MAMRHLTTAAFVLILISAAGTAPAQELPAAPVIVQPTPKQSRFDKLASKTASLQKRVEVPLQSAGPENLAASVVRLEDLTAHESALALQITLSQNRGVITVSEEEMPDLKDSIQYILQNMAALNESADYVRIEYRTMSGASLGYMVHFATETGGEWPPTAYVHVPPNPFYPQSGGIQRVTIQGLQRIVAEAQEGMAAMRQQQQPAKK